MKKLSLLLGVAVIAAIALTAGQQPLSIEERFVRLQAQERFPAIAAQLKDQPVEVHALLLDYLNGAKDASDEVLVLKAQAALQQYPEQARRILLLYGTETKFQDILRRYGSGILPPIQFFLDNEVTSVTALHLTGQALERSKRAAARLWRSARALQWYPPDAGAQGSDLKELTAEQRGWHAINFIHAEGYNFLGQFVLNESGSTQWVQTERALENLNALFASGIRGLETKVRTEQEIGASDVAWAAVDVALIGSAVKLLRVGKTASATAKSTRSAAFTARLTSLGHSGMYAARYAKWPALLATAYVFVKHPSLIGDVLAEAAAIIGLPVGIAQVLGWTLIIFPLLYMATSLVTLLLGFSRGYRAA